MEHYSLRKINGNAFCIIGYVTRAMRDVGMSNTERYSYTMDAMSGTYDHLVSVSEEMITRVNQLVEADINNLLKRFTAQ